MDDGVARTADVVVIGGGLLGTATAFESAVAGLTTVLVDRHDPGRATDAGAGILSAETSGVADDGWFGFAMAAAAHYRQLVARLEGTAALDDAAYSPCGLLCVALHEDEVPWYEERLALALSRTTSGLREITAAEARALFPPLGEPVRALYSPFAARVDGRRLRSALQRAGASHGSRRLAADVTGLVLEHGRATGVLTSAGPISCGAVVIAGGAWSPAFGSALGVDLPVAPLKGQIVHLQFPAGNPAEGAAATGWSETSGRWPIVQPVLNHYLVPWPGGRVACGGTLEPRAGFDDRPTAAGVHELLREAMKIAPGLAGATFTEVRVGLRPMSGDGQPIIGAAPGWSNVFVATGHGTEGLLLGPYTGRLVAALVGGRELPAQGRGAALDAFSPHRFAS